MPRPPTRRSARVQQGGQSPVISIVSTPQAESQESLTNMVEGMRFNSGSSGASVPVGTVAPVSVLPLPIPPPLTAIPVEDVAGVDNVAVVMFVYTKGRSQFVPKNQMFAYNPTKRIHRNLIEVKKEQVKECANKLGVKVQILELTGKSTSINLKKIGGIERNFCSFVNKKTAKKLAKL